MTTRREEAAARVRTLHPPLPTLFAALRADLSPEPPPEPAPAPAPAPADPLLTAFAPLLADPGDDADDLALRLALAGEHVIAAAAHHGAKAARDAGVPTSGDVDPTDAVVALLQPYAAMAVAGEPLPGDLAVRVRGVARSAGVLAAVRGTGWYAVQRFGEPWCPRDGCYGRDGARLDDTTDLPPYGDGCNCSAEAVAPPPG